ncbi:arsenite efflux MFS transporter ArsK [Rhizobium sp. SSA_523]|uniref:arsenite efflux MFS transporter ArsK n=1 Tax=Rhizobium sp. SSA_523 TaxID=2952477 RepID=UPI002091BA2C|nr:arsenite efflux MFS transporter ArsK [Rhizobium sp. SSA_523]MCO5734552.1 arsenite efflux MFS transporter ArsK [Rhizobium sp. SSA_523]WKC23334.1 arsenite efflux MFS transporter ArsK [Rhizobium sp. SSA_523]
MSSGPPVAVILALGLTQIIGYGTLYYSFSILAPDMARDLGWSVDWVFGLLSASLFLSGLTAPFAGRLMDRFGAGRVMTLGSFAAALSLMLCALAPHRAVFVAGLLLTELSANLVQYGAAFALLVEIRPREAQRSITYLTLIAGFASTIFWPVTSLLHGALTWQAVYMVFAGLNLVLCLPLHAWLSLYGRGGRHAPDHSVDSAGPVPGLLAERVRQKGFRLMLSGIGILSFVNAALLFHMVPVLSDLGLGAAAVLVATLFGPAQVLSRFTNMIFGRNLGALQLAVLTALFAPLSILVLELTYPFTPGAMLFAVIFGFGSGLSSIVFGTLPLALFGSEGYGARQGQISLVRLAASALSPFGLAVILQRAGPDMVLWSLIGLGLVALCFFIALSRLGQVGPASQAGQVR